MKELKTMYEIKISDLSIGDWVRYKSCVSVPMKVLEIGEKYGISEEGEIYITGETNVSEVGGLFCEVDDIEPIPLTPEILEKNGLEYIDDGNDAVIFLCCDMFWARLCVGDTFWQVGIHSEDRLDAVVCNVKYTHQLQHALRLAGVEKEVIL